MSDAHPDIQAFTSVWSALRENYKGTNITKTVARLLHMYQPKDGIVAYERLLTTLSVLLDGFDINKFQLLISMVPLPERVTTDVVNEVFYKATGFVRIGPSLFSKMINDNNLSVKQNQSGDKYHNQTDNKYENNSYLFQYPENKNIIHATDSICNKSNQTYSQSNIPQKKVMFNEKYYKTYSSKYSNKRLTHSSFLTKTNIQNLPATNSCFNSYTSKYKHSKVNSSFTYNDQISTGYKQANINRPIEESVTPMNLDKASKYDQFIKIKQPPCNGVNTAKTSTNQPKIDILDNHENRVYVDDILDDFLVTKKSLKIAIRNFLHRVKNSRATVSHSSVSSTETIGDYHPYYSDRLRQESQLPEEHHRHLSMNFQSAVDNTAHGRLTNMHNASYKCMEYDNNERSSLKRLNLRRQSLESYERKMSDGKFKSLESIIDQLKTKDRR